MDNTSQDLTFYEGCFRVPSSGRENWQNSHTGRDNVLVLVEEKSM